jgi:predicted Zn finger-like uncharacterized protein
MRGRAARRGASHGIILTMSLATRCTACGTVFRVVQDQLKVSEGWVRCGRCDEVFNALEGLFDLEREPPPLGPLPAASSAQRPPPGLLHGAPPGTGHDDHGWPLTRPVEDWEPSLPDRLGTEVLSVRPGDGDRHEPLRHDDPVEFSNARWDAELLTDVAAQETQIVEYELDEGTRGAADDDGETRLMERDEPEFLRRAERQARWRRPGVRLLMGALALALLAALGLQAAHHFRDLVAVRWPQTRPALEAWCGLAQCTLEAPRRIDDVSVESTTLARAAGTPDAFRLSVNLRNRGSLPIGLPSVDLKLTDGSGALVARRMLSPGDFGAAPAALQPGAETMLQALLSTGSLGVAGYTVEVFYP